ncbi:hypothetical protein E9531_15675 [Lampropedia puyangensis]|uniref:Uncharacterized protein n=1 Tax=Lampropedia puyangensis TaxID=1330072 RepID=A0A4S8ESY4_9BURK|nr:hypothetical protein [Lampropedia puyangensis]THT97576.1 hypothetical protein E9531_15675 [Lampropedia puyangensis]
MPLAGNALVAIWNDILPESRDDFFEWHPREHMVERLGIQGFLRGRRYIALDDSVEFLTLYEVSAPEVLASQAYLARVTNPTPWSSRVLPAFRNNARGACKLLFSQGHAMGGFVATLRLEAEPGKADAFDRAIVEQVLPGLLEQPHLCGVHYVVNDESLTSGNSGNQRGRVITLPERIVLIEGISAAALTTLLSSRLAAQTWPPLGAKTTVQTGLYQLEYSIQNLATGT